VSNAERAKDNTEQRGEEKEEAQLIERSKPGSNLVKGANVNNGERGCSAGIRARRRGKRQLLEKQRENKRQETRPRPTEKRTCVFGTKKRDRVLGKRKNGRGKQKKLPQSPTKCGRAPGVWSREVGFKWGDGCLKGSKSGHQGKRREAAPNQNEK